MAFEIDFYVLKLHCYRFVHIYLLSYFSKDSALLRSIDVLTLKKLNNLASICLKTMVETYRTLLKRVIMDCKSSFPWSNAVFAAVKANFVL